MGGPGVMKFRLQHLPAPVARVLRVFDGLQRLYRLLRILCSCAVVYLALALLAMHVDRFFFLTPGAREALWWIAHGLAGGMVVVRVALFLVRRSSVRQVAYQLQDRFPDLAAEKYVTLDSVLREPEDPANSVRRQLLQQLKDSTEAHSAHVKPFRLVRTRPLAGAAAGLLGAVAVYGLLAVLPGYQFPLMVRRFLHPASNLPKPSFIRIRVTPDAIVIGRGGEVVIQAETQGEIPGGLAWLYRLAGAVPNRCVMAFRPGQQTDVRMDLATAQDWSRVQRQLFLYTQSDLQESFSYRLRCGDAETEVRFVDVVTQPRITDLRVKVRPPPYTHLPSEEIANPKQPVRLYAGSAVDLVFTVDQAVSNRLVFAGGKKLAAPAWNEATRTGRYAFTMSEKVDLEVRVVNARGFANVDRARVSLVKLEDQAPTVRLEYPPGELAVVPGELVPLQALAEDDLEVASALVRMQLNPELNPDAPFQETAIALPEPHGKRVSLTENIDLGQTAAVSGDEILLLLRVRDSKGNDGESRPVRIRVSSFARGENERRRLAALGILQDGLTALGDAPAAGAPVIDRERYSQVAKKAAGAGVVLEDAATVDSLLRLLELEQHFTDAPKHKEDVRRLAGVIGFAWMSGRLPSAIANHAPWPETLAKHVLSPMTASRRLQNLAWRIFGLQYEIDDIRRRIRGIAGERASQESDRRQALESFIEAVAEDAAQRKDVLDAVRNEQEIRKQIGEVKSRATAAPKPEGGVVDNPFAGPQLEVEKATLSTEDGKKVAALDRELKKLVSERQRLSAEAVCAVTNRWMAGRKGLPIPLETSKLAALAATVHDRIVRPPAGEAASGSPEARRQLAATLAAERLQDRESGEGAAQKSLHRRAELYLKTLEDIGVDLSSMADAMPGRLNAERLKSLQGELNTSGYHLSRGDPVRGIAACDDIARLLGLLLDEVRPGLPALLRDEQKARSFLEGLYAAAWREVATVPVERTGIDWRRRWVEADYQMLERNPFAPMWPRAMDLLLSTSLDRRLAGLQAGARSDTNLAALLEPPAAVAAAVTEERRFWALLAAEWELADLQASTRVSPAEKALAAGLVAFGELLEAGEPAAAEVAALEKKLQQKTPDVASLPPADLGGGLRRQRQAMNLQAIEAALAPVVRSRVVVRKPVEEARVARERMAGAAAAVATLETALLAGDAGVTNAIFQAMDTLADAVRGCDRVVRLSALDAGWLDPLGPDAAQEELLYVRIREAVERYHGRAGESVRGMREMAGHELDAAQLGNLGADLTIVKAGVQALQNTLASAVDEYGSRQNRHNYPILQMFTETRTWLQEAGELARSERQAEVARRFIQESPFARFEFLGARSGMLDAALRELATVEHLLEEPVADAAATQRKLDAARSGLAGFLVEVGKAGKGDLQETVGKSVADLAGRLDRVARAGETDDRRRFLAVADVVKDGNRLLHRLRVDVGAAATEQMEYAGGPDRIWMQDTRLPAEVSRQRLLGQIRWGRRAFAMGMLEPLEPAPDARRYADAAAWSLFCHRVARSSLSGVVTPPRSEAGGDSARNPLVKWLLEQVDEAAKETQSEDTLRNYRGITRELIPSLKDYLRY